MKKRILVVEDDPAVADMMHLMLKKIGHEFLIVTSSGSALEMAESQDFSVLLSDLGLPKSGDKPQKVDEFAGFELAENICAMIPGIKVIFCTGKDIAIVQDMLPAGLGPVSFLQKPFRFHELQRAVSPRKMAAVVAIASPEKEAEAIRELEKGGYVVHVPFEDTHDSLAAEILRRELMPMYDEVVVRTS